MKLNLDETDLEKALTSEKKEPPKKECKCKGNGEECKCDSNEEIGFHKGCLNTLMGERNELVKMIQTVEAIMQAHIKKLSEMGVKLETKKE
jgi:hypothetical protein